MESPLSPAPCCREPAPPLSLTVRREISDAESESSSRPDLESVEVLYLCVCMCACVCNAVRRESTRQLCKRARMHAHNVWMYTCTQACSQGVHACMYARTYAVNTRMPSPTLKISVRQSVCVHSLTRARTFDNRSRWRRRPRTMAALRFLWVDVTSGQRLSRRGKPCLGNQSCSCSGVCMRV